MARLEQFLYFINGVEVTREYCSLHLGGMLDCIPKDIIIEYEMMAEECFMVAGAIAYYCPDTGVTIKKNI